MQNIHWEACLCDESNGNEVTLINYDSVSNMVIGNTILEHNNKLMS
jgi:hypothetical protein